MELLLLVLLALPLLPCSEDSLRECVGCHLELPADLRDREEVLLLPVLPDLAP